MKAIPIFLIITLFAVVNAKPDSTNKNTVFRNLETEINTNELGNFYYPVSDLSLLQGYNQTLEPINTKSNDEYTYECTRILTPEEFSFDKNTGIIFIRYADESAPGEFIITVTNSDEYKTSFIVRFLDDPYMKSAHYHYTSALNVRCPHVMPTTSFKDGDFPSGEVNMFKRSQTVNNLIDIFNDNMISMSFYLNITGYFLVEEKGNYEFFIDGQFGSYIVIDDKVVVSTYEECGSLGETSSGEFELEAGYHPIVLHALSGNPQTFDDKGEMGGWGFDFKYKKANGENQYFTLYNVPSFIVANSLVFFKNSYAWGNSVNQEIEFTVSNASNCFTEPALPDGISITTSVISGISSTTFKQNYLVYCKSSYSTSNIFNITIEVTDIFLTGLVGYYMKFDTFIRPDTANNPMPNRNDPSAHLKVLRIEEVIDKDYSPIPVVWTGLSQDFISEYGVYWEGVVEFPKSGDYEFQIICDDYCAVNFDYFQALSVRGDGSGNKTYTNTVKVTGSNLRQNILVKYSQYKGQTGFAIKVKGPDDNEFRYPSDLFFYNPPSNLQYTYSVAVYLANEALPVSNKPIISNIDIESDPPKYSINKKLPEGIILDEDTGYIEGKPLAEAARDEYIITATFKNHDPLSVNIFISVEDMPTPTNVYFFNVLTKESYQKEGTIPLGQRIVLQATEDSGVSISRYTLEGSLPVSTLDTDSGLLTGQADEEGTFQLILQACHGVSCTTSSINITVINQCDSNNNQPLLISLSYQPRAYQLSIDDSTGKNVVPVIEIGNMQEDYYYYVCLKEENYKVKVWDTAGAFVAMTINMYVKGKQIYSLTQQGHSGAGGTYEYNIKATTIPTAFAYSTSDLVFQQFEITEYQPIYYNQLFNFRLEPDSLPSGISFSSNGVISGISSTKFEKRKFNITAETLYGGLVLTEITMEGKINQCAVDSQSLLHVNLYSDSVTDAYLDNVLITVKDSQNKIILEIKPDDIRQKTDFFICVNVGNYNVSCATTDARGNGWNRIYADFYLYDAPIYHCDLPERKDEKYEIISTLYLSYNLYLNTVWEYNSNYVVGWNTDSFTGTWNSAKISDISTTGTTLYLRKKITINSLDTFSSFYSRLDVLSGYVYYINGQEVGRINLPDGTLSDTQKATSQFNLITAISYVLPASMFDNEQVLVAIELHKYSDDEKLSDFSIYSVDLQGDEQESCTRLNKFATVIDNSRQYMQLIPSYAIDGNVNTAFGTYAYGYITISFGENKYIYVNRYMVNCGGNNAPKNMTIEAKTGNSDYKQVGTLVLPTSLPYAYYSTDIYDNTDYINEIKLNMLDNIRTMMLNEFTPGICHIFYCMKTDLLPYTKGGLSVDISCPNGLAGTRTFLCPTGRKPQWREIENNCPIQPELLSKEDSLIFTIGKAQSNVIFFTYSGFVSRFYTNPALPSCIKQQEFKTGIYDVSCYSELSQTEFTFFLENNYGKISFTIPITISPTNDPVITEYVTSYTFYAGVASEPVSLFKAIGPSLQFEVSPALPEGLKIDPYNGQISGTPTDEVEEKKYAFTVSNSYNKVTISIAISVSVTDDAVILEQINNYEFVYGYEYNELQLYRVVGKQLSYMIGSSSLPKDMKLNEATGNFNGKIISKDSGSFTITATPLNGKGVDIRVDYTVKEVEEPIVVTTEKEYVFKVGIDGTIKLFEVAGENITYSVNPPLPEGLTLNQQTGEISGNVKSSAGTKIYTFYMSNAKGEASVSIQLSFSTPIEPIILSSTNSVSFIKNVYIENVELVKVAGVDCNYKISPELPDGIKFNQKTGIITGTPTANSNNQNYTVEVYNAYGNGNVSISIEVITKYCEKNGDWERTEITIKSYAGCGGAYSGNKYRFCLATDNGEAVWGGVIDDCSLQTGLIVGIVVVCIVALALIVLVVVFCVYRRNAIKKVNSDKRSHVITDKGIHM